LANRYHVDKLFLNKIEDWNTNMDHARQTFMNDPEFQDELAKAKANPIVRTWTLS